MSLSARLHAKNGVLYIDKAKITGSEAERVAVWYGFSSLAELIKAIEENG